MDIDLIILAPFYFFSVFTLSKLAEQVVIDSNLKSFFLLLIPPLYFLHLTKHFFFSLAITLIAYFFSYSLYSQGVPILMSVIPMIIPITIANSLITYHVRASQNLIFLNFFPPFIWSLLVIIYLAFFHKREMILPTWNKIGENIAKEIIATPGHGHVLTAYDLYHLKKN